MSFVLNKIVDLARYANHFLNGFFDGAQGGDVWFIAGFAVAAMLFSLVLKRRRVVIFSLAIYVVSALYYVLPFEWGLKITGNLWIFLGAVAVIFLLLKSTISNSVYGGYSGGDYSGRIKLFLLSVITLGFLVSTALNFVADIDFLSRAELVGRLFLGDFSRGLWAVLPLAGFFFLRK